MLNDVHKITYMYLAHLSYLTHFTHIAHIAHLVHLNPLTHLLHLSRFHLHYSIFIAMPRLPTVKDNHYLIQAYSSVKAQVNMLKVYGFWILTGYRSRDCFRLAAGSDDIYRM